MDASNTVDNIRDILRKHQLPFLVQIVDGFDGPTEKMSFSKDEILTIHTTMELKRIRMTDERGNCLLIPVDSSARVQIVNKASTQFYDLERKTMARRCPKFIRVHKRVPELELEDGDILEPVVNEVSVQKDKEAFLECKVLRQFGRRVNLPMGCVSSFQCADVLDPRRYNVRYMADSVAFPVTVRFVEDAECNPFVQRPLAGEFIFEEVVKESVVVASTTIKQNLTVLKLPTDLPISLNLLKEIDCNGGYIEQTWKIIQKEIDQVERLVTDVRYDLLPTSYDPSVEREANEEELYYQMLSPQLPPKHGATPYSPAKRRKNPDTGATHIYESLTRASFPVEDVSLAPGLSADQKERELRNDRMELGADKETLSRRQAADIKRELAAMFDSRSSLE